MKQLNEFIIKYLFSNYGCLVPIAFSWLFCFSIWDVDWYSYTVLARSRLSINRYLIKLLFNHGWFFSNSITVCDVRHLWMHTILSNLYKICSIIQPKNIPDFHYLGRFLWFGSLGWKKLEINNLKKQLHKISKKILFSISSII